MGFVERLGAEALFYTNQAGRMMFFLVECLWASCVRPINYPPSSARFISSAPVPSSVIVLTGLFTGMVLALQGYHLLSEYGSVGALGVGVAMGLVRELGPVLTALMVIGRAGSAICAEIGIMRNSEQIDALECMAVDPLHYLLAPKYLAGAIISVSLLTAFSTWSASWGVTSSAWPFSA